MDVGGAAAPLPALLLVVETLLLLVAAAAAQAPLGAGGGDCVGDPGSDDSVGERGLLAACDKEEKTFLITTTGFTISGSVKPPYIPGIAASNQIIKYTSRAKSNSLIKLSQSR